jgi:hypothetical protein
MGQGLEAYRHLARTGQGEGDIAVGSDPVISKDDGRTLTLTYDLALGKILQQWQRDRKLAIYTNQIIMWNQGCLGS